MKKTVLGVLVAILAMASDSAMAGKTVWFEPGDTITHGDPNAKICVSGFEANATVKFVIINEHATTGGSLMSGLYADGAGAGCRYLYTVDANAPNVLDRLGFPIPAGPHEILTFTENGKRKDYKQGISTNVTILAP